MKNRVARWCQELAGASSQEVLAWAYKTFDLSGIALSSSLGLEDMVLTDMLMKLDPEFPVFTLDTGRLFQETYDLMEEVRLKWKLSMKVLFPDRAAVEALVREKGPNSFYYSLENRKECCRIRKIDPLKRELSTLDAWICGLRKEQSVTRTAVRKVEWDEAFGLVKLNPLADWSEQQCRDYVKDNHVPVHALHKKGFPSIGCAPCTRAVKPDEGIRDGRWWWENPESRECGLHRKS